MVKILMALGLCFGAVAGLVIAILAVQLPWIFSSDAAVAPLIYATALPAFVALTVRYTPDARRRLDEPSFGCGAR